MCLPSTPISRFVLTASGTLASVETSALSQYFPVKGAVITLAGCVQGTQQVCEILQVRVTEKASTGNAKKKGLIVYFFTDAAPSNPTTGAVWDAPTTNYVGEVHIATADYKRRRSGADELWTATIVPQRDTDAGALFFKSGTSADAANLYAVVVADEAVTYAASTDITVEVFNAMHYGAVTLL